MTNRKCNENIRENRVETASVNITVKGLRKELA
jgi:hypothetical protein